MKRISALLLLAAVIFSLCGCGGVCVSSCTEASTPPAIATEAPAVTEPVMPSAEPTEPSEAPTAPPETLPEQPEPEDDAMVRVADHIPQVRQALAYATNGNFTGQTIYDFSDAFLRYGTVKKLASVSRELEEDGVYLLIWDAFRPVSAQYALWSICPDPTFVADPTKGFSSHSRGNTVDLTLVDENGALLEMPTGFDDFSSLADRDYSDCSDTAAENARLLEAVMEKHGFTGYWGEWWHFSDTDSYSVPQDFTPVAPSWHCPDCREFISLRTEADTGADVIVRIPVGEEFQVLALQGDFALVQYRTLQGYVLRSYIQPV